MTSDLKRLVEEGRAMVATLPRLPWRFHAGGTEHMYTRWNEDDEKVVYLRGHGVALEKLVNALPALLSAAEELVEVRERLKRYAISTVAEYERAERAEAGWNQASRMLREAADEDQRKHDALLGIEAECANVGPHSSAMALADAVEARARAARRKAP